MDAQPAVVEAVRPAAWKRPRPGGREGAHPSVAGAPILPIPYERRTTPVVGAGASWAAAEVTGDRPRAERGRAGAPVWAWGGAGLAGWEIGASQPGRYGATWARCGALGRPGGEGSGGRSLGRPAEDGHDGWIVRAVPVEDSQS